MLYPIFSIQSASVSVQSKRSSRKRSREIYWSEILAGTDADFGDDEYVSTQSFAEMNEAQKSHFFKQREVSDATKKIIVDKLLRALGKEALPLPSNMTWKDAEKILDAIKYDETELMKDLPEHTDTEDIFSKLEKIFANKSEMDACIRIIFLLYYVFRNVKGLQIEAQPSFSGHSTFTDFIIRLSVNDKILLLIEVKRSDINTSLRLRNKETAQIIREVHIALATRDDSELPFLLTNSIDWSFGLARRKGSKIEIFSVKHVDLHATNSISLLTQLLKKYGSATPTS